jgi:hypothetical protein
MECIGGMNMGFYLTILRLDLNKNARFCLKNNKAKKTRGRAQVVQLLPGNHEALSSPVHTNTHRYTYTHMHNTNNKSSM